METSFYTYNKISFLVEADNIISKYCSKDSPQQSKDFTGFVTVTKKIPLLPALEPIKKEKEI